MAGQLVVEGTEAYMAPKLFASSIKKKLFLLVSDHLTRMLR
jgi:hypothetical protein